MKRGLSKPWSSIVLVAGGCLTVLGLMEIHFRWISPTPPLEDGRYQPYLVTNESPEGAGYLKSGLIYYYRPETVVASIEERGSYLFGDRLSRSFPDQKASHKRIVFIGLSADSLEKELRQRLRSDEIDVFSLTGHHFVTTEERLVLELYVLPKKPDAVVLLNGSNDMDALLRLSRPGDPGDMGARYARYDSPTYQLVLLVSKLSAVARHFTAKKISDEAWRSIHAIERDPRLSGNYVRGIASVYNDNLRRMSRRCHQEKVPCFFLFQPRRNVDLPLYGRLASEMLEAVRKEGRFSPGTQFTDLTQLADQSPEVLARLVADMLQASHALGKQE